MRVSATAKYLRGSTRKANLVTSAIRGRRVEDASATANAENNHNLAAEDLVIVEAHANEGPTLKRWKPRAQGRAFAIHKPMTHITIVLEEREA